MIYTFLQNHLVFLRDLYNKTQPVCFLKYNRNIKLDPLLTNILLYLLHLIFFRIQTQLDCDHPYFS